MGASLKPSEMTAGGAPTDRNMLIKSARYVHFTYTRKDGSPVMKSDNSGPAMVVAGRLELVEDDGAENVQHYSVGDPGRYEISEDGKSLGPEGVTIQKSCNMAVLMNGVVNAGFPENRLTDDISVLDGLYAYWIGVPEPKRPGLVRTAEQEARGDRVLPVPSVIHKLPWEKAKAGQKLPASAPVAAKAGVKKGASVVGGDILNKTVEFIGGVIDEVGSATRQELAQRIFTDLAKDPNRDQIAATMFSPAIQAALLAAGFAVDGEIISKE